MPPQQYRAQLEERIIHNDKFIQLNFELLEPHEMSFAAGQYVSLKVAPDGTRRSYSICSSPAITHGFELTADVSPGGVGSQFLLQSPLGTQVELLGPMGTFTIADDPQEEAVVLVGTGSGIAPLRSMVLDLLQVKKDPRPISLFWGLRYVESMYWQNDFQDLVESFSNFSFHPVVSRAIDEWPLCRGRVTDCLSIHQLPTNAGYYLCGGKPMIIDVVALLESKGISPQHIHHEKFF